jgi:hypothetical protein
VVQQLRVSFASKSIERVNLTALRKKPRTDSHQSIDATMSTDNDVKTVLKGPAEWLAWNREFRRIMEGYNLLDYLDGKQDLIRKPMMPDQDPLAQENYINEQLKALLEALLSKLPGNPDSTASTPTDSEAAADMQATVPQDPDDEIPGFKRLSEADKKVYRDRRTRLRENYTGIETALNRRHDVQYKEWSAQEKHLNQARATLNSTVGQRLRTNHLESSDIRLCYNNLREACLDNGATERATAASLASHLAVLRSAKSVNQATFNQWLTQWENLIADGTALGIDQAIRPKIWFEDLMGALVEVMPQYALHAQEQGRQDYDALVPRIIAGQARAAAAAYLPKEQPRGRVAKGSFPSFGSPERAGDDQSTKRKRSPDSHQRERKRRPSPSDEDRPRCKACKNPHPTSDCFYLFPEKAFKGWIARDSIKTRVEQALKADPNLRTDAQRQRRPRGNKLNKRKSRDQEQDTDGDGEAGTTS